MNLVFVSPTNEHVWPGFETAIKMAKENSGCNVHAFQSDGCGTHENNFMKVVGGRIQKHRLDIMAIRRNLILLDHVGGSGMKPPYVSPDWDFLIFRNLVKAFNPFLKFDFSTSVFDEGLRGLIMPAHLLTSIDPLVEFYNATMRLADGLSDGMYQSDFNDMVIWREVALSKKFTVGNTLNSSEGCFDPGMHHTEDNPIHYIADKDGYKRIAWIAGAPYFTSKFENKLIPANWIHCWGKYKTEWVDVVEKYNTKFTS